MPVHYSKIVIHVDNVTEDRTVSSDRPFQVKPKSAIFLDLFVHVSSEKESCCKTIRIFSNIPIRCRRSVKYFLPLVDILFFILNLKGPSGKPDTQSVRHVWVGYAIALGRQNSGDCFGYNVVFTFCSIYEITFSILSRFDCKSNGNAT